MSIPEAELNLEPCPVDVKDIHSAYPDVGAEVKTVSSTGKVVDYQPDLLPEGFALCNQFIGFPFLSIDVKPLHPVPVGVPEIDLRVQSPGTSAFPCAWTLVDVVEHRIGTEAAHKGDPHLPKSLDKRQVGERGVRHHQRRDPQ